MGCSIKFFLLIKIFNISQTRTFYDKISLPHIRNILVFTDKQTDKQKNSKNKKCHDTPSIHTNIVCKFELSILSTFREKLGHTHRQTEPQSPTLSFIVLEIVVWQNGISITLYIKLR